MTPDEWLDRFAQHVRARDLDGARPLFAREVRSFGTRAERVDDLDALVALQWTPIWTSTRDFRFDPERTIFGAESDGTCTVATTWTSTGITPDGSGLARRGRATIVLRASGDGWVAVHTHFSETPAASAVAQAPEASAG